MEDVDATLAELEERLRALQADLAAEDDPQNRASTSPPEGWTTRHSPPGEGAAPAGGDPLDAFGDRLRRTSAELVSAYDEALGQARGGDGELFDDEVAIEAHADLGGLCALARALDAVPGVHGVELRAYAGGHAALDVALDRPVALVTELRSRGGLDFGVLASRPGRLALDVGAHESAQDSSRG